MSIATRKKGNSTLQTKNKLRSWSENTESTSGHNWFNHHTTSRSTTLISTEVGFFFNATNEKECTLLLFFQRQNDTHFQKRTALTLSLGHSRGPKMGHGTKSQEKQCGLMNHRPRGERTASWLGLRARISERKRERGDGKGNKLQVPFLTLQFQQRKCCFSLSLYL